MGQAPRQTLPLGKRTLLLQFGLGLLVIAAHLLLLASSGLQRVESLVLDAFFRQRGRLATHPAIVYIEIAEDGLQAIGRWPWPRHYHAAMAALLKDWGARAVVFDMLFSEPSTEFDDGALREALQQFPSVYLPVILEPQAEGVVWIHSLPAFEEAARGIGHINITPDPDGSLRRIQPYLAEGGHAYPHLSLRIAYDYLGQPLPTPEALPFPRDADGNLLINWSGRWTQTFTHYSYVDLLKSFEAARSGGQPLIAPDALKDKLCLIGLTATGHADTKVTPLEPAYPAVGVHANVINSILTKQFVTPAPMRANLLCLLGVGLLGLLGFVPFRRVSSLIAGVVLGLAWVGSAYALFVRQGLWLYVAHPLLLLLSLFVVSAISAVVIGHRAQTRLFRLATRDGLTELYQIRHFRGLLDQAMREARTRQQPLSLLLADVDHFKRINDTYGHQAGDQVLKQTAQVIQSCIRQKRAKDEMDEVAARYGGEEFIVMLRKCDLENAASKVAERIRQTVEQTTFQWSGTAIPVTISLGVSTLRPDDQEPDRLIRRADQALYHAKANGRNRVSTETALVG